MKNAVIIKIESGIVADIYVTEPMHIVIVDHDMIEGGESFDQRLRKSVFSMNPEKSVIPCQIDDLVASLVLECERPGDGQERYGAGFSGECDGMSLRQENPVTET